MRSLRRVGVLGAATLALGAACFAGSADADSIGQVMKGPDTTPVDGHVPWTVQATLSGNTVTITNPGQNEGLVFAYDNGDPGIITSVDLNGPGGYTGNGGVGGNGLVANGSFTANKPFTVQSPSSINACDIIDYINVHCVFADYRSQDASGGIKPGQSATITYPTNMPGYLQSVSINFDYDDLYLRCRPDGFGSDGASGSGVIAPDSAGGFYAKDCAAPTHVRITAMHINTKKHTASFRQAAKRATSFRCTLNRNNHVLFDHSCSAKKAYTNRLPKGNYLYQVWALDKSGVSADFAVAHFRLP